MLCAQLIGAVATLSLASASPPASGDARLVSGEAVAHLDVRPWLDGAEERTLSIAPRATGIPVVPPPCIADVCQARVEVPGFETKFSQPHRSELFAAVLDRAGIEPFASIAWMFVVTGFRLDYTPPAFDAGDPASAHSRGWGSVFVRLRLRMDPRNLPVFPVRHGPEHGATALNGLHAEE